MSNAVHWAFVALGACNLIPWVSFLAIGDYFAATYGSNAMEFAFPATSTTTLVITSALVLAVGHQLPFWARIPLPTALSGLCMLGVPLLDLCMRAELISLGVAWDATVLVVFLSTATYATAHNSLYALGGLAGGSATQALQMGFGIIGVVSVGLRALTKLGLGESASMWLFCVSGAACMLLSLLAYAAIAADAEVAPRVRTHEAERRRRAAASASGTLSAKLLPSGAEAAEVRWRGVVAHVWREATAAYLVFTVTLTCFPGLSTSFASHEWGMGGWYSLALVGLYSAGDLAGKTLPASVRLFGSDQLLGAVGGHWCFVPAFLLLLRAQASKKQQYKRTHPLGPRETLDCARRRRCPTGCRCSSSSGLAWAPATSAAWPSCSAASAPSRCTSRRAPPSSGRARAASPPSCCSWG